MAMTTASEGGGRKGRAALEMLAAALLLAAAVLWASWPLAARLGSALPDPASRPDAFASWRRADLDLLVWILSWTMRALVLAPGEIFQANAFHPAPDALAGSENLLGLAPIAAPIWWASQDAILTYGLTVLVVVWLSALGTFALVRAWSGSFVGGILAAVAFALSRESAGDFVRLHWSAVSLFPVIVLLAWRASHEPRPARLVALALATALQALAGVYVAYELAILLTCLAPALVVVAADSASGARAAAAGAPAPGTGHGVRQDRDGDSGSETAGAPAPGVGHVVKDNVRGGFDSEAAGASVPGTGRSVIVGALLPLAALVAGGLALLPVARVYARAASRQSALAGDGATATLELLRRTGGTPGEVLATLTTALGWPLLALAVVAPFAGRRSLRPLRLGLLAAGGVGLALAFGPVVGLVPGTTWPSPFELAVRVIPGFSGIRGPERFLILPTFAAAVLGGGLAGEALLEARRRGGIWALGGRAAAIGLLVWACGLTTARLPAGGLRLLDLSLARDDSFAVHRWLRESEAEGPVLLVPQPRSALDVPRLLGVTGSQVGSTLHWLPLVHGYTGHPPAGTDLVRALVARLPGDPQAFADLCALTGMRWILVDESHLPPDEIRRWSLAVQMLPLSLETRQGETRVYRVRQDCGGLVAAFGAELRALPEMAGKTSLHGVPLTALPAATTRGVLRLQAPVQVVAGMPVSLQLAVRNDGDATWPGLDASPRGPLVFELHFVPGDLAAGVDAAAPPSIQIPLARDLAAGEGVVVPALVFAPPPGDWRLEGRLVQRGHGAVPGVAPASVALRSDRLELGRAG